MNWIKILFKPKSLLAFLTAVSFVAYLLGITLKAVSPAIGAELMSFTLPIFMICFVIWLVYMFLSLMSRVK
jgi:hypothetical protein